MKQQNKPLPTIKNYTKHFAIYARFFELLKTKKYPSLAHVYTQVAYEFGFAFQTEASRVVRAVRLLKHHPRIQYESMVYEGFHYDYVYRYSSDEDLRILEKIKKHPQCTMRVTNNVIHAYYLYREYQRMIKLYSKARTLNNLAEDFYITVGTVRTKLILIYRIMKDIGEK